MIKSFRGLLKDGGDATIRLSTNNGLIGYKINKFEVLPEVYGTGDQVSLVKISTVPIDTTSTVNFDIPTLLAVGVIRVGNLITETMTQVTVFDNVKFNQDIYITLKNLDASLGVNYYLELEQVKLSLDEATVATLKDMRGRE
jgi:hypothetical protein